VSRLIRREAELVTEHGQRWLEGFTLPLGWRRGFPEILDVSPRVYLDSAAVLERIAPVQAVRLVSFAATGQENVEDWDEEDRASKELVDRLAACPLLGRWVELEFAACPGFDIFEAVVTSPHLSRLRRLVAIGNEVGPGVELVVDARFRNLRWLDLLDSNSAGGRPGDDVFVSMVTSPYLAQLEYLNFGANEVGDEGVAALAASPTMARLRSLCLCVNYISPVGLRALGESTALLNLRHLDLSGSMSNPPLDDAALAAFLESPRFAQLTSLNMQSNAITDEGVRRLAQTPAVAKLRALMLGGIHYYPGAPFTWEQEPQVTPASVRTLATSPYLSGLCRLELLGVELDDETAHVLAQSQALSACVRTRSWGRIMGYENPTL
jgi:hypothetical protein